jgi:hypothetical protein
MKAELTQVINNKLYEVFFDEDSYHRWNDIEFENEEQEQEYKEKLESGELIYFGVVESVLCACCNQWKEEHSCWGFDCSTPEEALKCYL